MIPNGYFFLKLKEDAKVFQEIYTSKIMKRNASTDRRDILEEDTIGLPLRDSNNVYYYALELKQFRTSALIV